MLACFRLARTRLRSAPRLAVLITAVGMSFIVQNISLAVFDVNFRSVPPLISDHNVFSIGGVHYNWQAFFVILVTVPVLLVLTFFAGSQIYYPFGLLAVLFAAGCIPVVEYVDRSRLKLGAVLVGAVALNAAVSAVIALPLLPVQTLGASPIPALNQLAADQVGWPEYTQQVASAYRSVPAGERERAVVITSNYGEAGAVARFGPDLGLPAPYSGHNQLYFDRMPPERTETAVIVGGQAERVSAYFASCEQVGTLDPGLGVDSEEQGQPIAVCRSPIDSWGAIWPAFRWTGAGSPSGPGANLFDRLLARDVGHPCALQRRPSGDVEQKGRFADAGVAAQQDRRARHHAAAADPVELGHAGDDTRRLRRV